MSTLSEISLLVGQRAGDLEKAREIFNQETRSFVKGILAGIRRARPEWVAGRVRLDVPREIEPEGKASSSWRSHSASTRVPVRFKKGTNFQVVADVLFGIEFEDQSDHFVWTITLVPAARYQRMDDLLWQQWRAGSVTSAPPAAAHLDKANMVRFARRPVDAELTGESAFNDVKCVLEFLLAADAPLAESVGLDALPGEDAATPHM